MIIFLQIYKKSCLSLLVVLTSFCMFSNTNTALFIQQCSQVNGLGHLDSTVYLVPFQGSIYVKETAVFHSSEKTTIAKLVNLSTTPSLQQGERLLSIISSKKGSATKQCTQVTYTIAPHSKFPFQRGAFSKPNNCSTTSTTPTLKISKLTFFGINYAYPAKADLAYANPNSKGMLDTHHYCLPHHKIDVLSSYCSLPPPTAKKQNACSWQKKSFSPLWRLEDYSYIKKQTL